MPPKPPFQFEVRRTYGKDHCALINDHCSIGGNMPPRDTPHSHTSNASTRPKRPKRPRPPRVQSVQRPHVLPFQFEVRHTYGKDH